MCCLWIESQGKSFATDAVFNQLKDQSKTNLKPMKNEINSEDQIAQKATCDTGHLEDLRARLPKVGDRQSLETMENFAESALTQLRHMADRVDAAESMRTHFLSHVRNELNNPVTSMLGLASRLSKVAPDEVDRIQTISRLLHSEARVLSFHLENIFAVADLEAGAAEPTWARLDLEELIQDVSEQYKSRLNDKALELTVENKMSDTHVVSDASKLNMILINLLANAVDFSRSGGEIHVVLENSEEDRSCTISVSDNGLGIPEKVQERIFDRFAQASSGFSKTHPGLGLGLTIVKGFAETLSGDVTVESKEGEGSCFKVRFVCPSDMEHLHDESEDGNEIFFGDEEVF